MMTHRLVWLWLFVIAVLGCMAALLGVFRLSRVESRLFQRYVLDPIPESVTEMMVDRAREVSGYGYTFRFKIDGADVMRIIDSRPFQRVYNVKYERWGELHFEWSPSSWSGLAVYPSGERKPAWFTPELWRDPDAYAYEERGKQLTTCVLLYNRQAGEAYFLAFKGDYTP